MLQPLFYQIIFQLYLYYRKQYSTTNTATHAATATVVRLFPFEANKIATTNPTAADIIESVAYKIAGKVIADNTANGM